MDIEIGDKDLFHVHTWRCHHAFKGISDEDVVKRAIEIGAESIYFTDHAPFPGNPFGNRMKYEQLDEYLWTLDNLRRKYKSDIKIYVGLEIEYFPKYDRLGYYYELIGRPGIDFLMLGQHMAEDPIGRYTFSWDEQALDLYGFRTLADAEIRGIDTGYFRVCAHPDRVFRRCKTWYRDMDILSEQIAKAAEEHEVILEHNISSAVKGQYRQKFWGHVPDDVDTIIGLDAHQMDELILPKNLPEDIVYQLKRGE